MTVWSCTAWLGENAEAEDALLILPRVVRLALLDGLRQGWNLSVSKTGVYRVHDGDSLLPAEPYQVAQRSQLLPNKVSDWTAAKKGREGEGGMPATAPPWPFRPG
jgi:hypothetical protein